MISRLFYSCAFVLILSITMCACSGRSINPISPNPQTGIADSQLTYDKTLSDSAPLGSFDFIIESSPLNVISSAPRQAAEIGDSWELEIGQYLQSNPCSDCLKVDDIGFNEDGQIVMKIGVRHPYPRDGSRLDLDVMDVRLIIIAQGSEQFSLTQCDGNPIVGNFQFVANPDGYTTHYDDGTDGPYPGNVNPYIDFFIEDDPSSTGFGKEIRNHRMAMGADYDYKQLVLNIPPGESIPLRMIIEASYGHSAKKSIAEGEPGSRTNPLYYLPEFNRKEVYSLKVNLDKIIYGNDPSLLIDFEMLDWQADAHVASSYPMGIQEIQGPSGVDEASLEMPQLDYYSMEPESTSGLGSPEEPLHMKFKVPVSDMSVYPLLATVRDQRDESSEDLDLTSYQHGQINTFIRVGENKQIKGINTSEYDSVLGQKAIAVDQNRIYITWADVENLEGVIYCARSIDGGQNFENPVKVNDANRDDSKLRPSIAVDEAHSVYVVWEDYCNLNPFSDAPDIYLSKSNNYGYSFGQDIQVNDDEDICDDSQTYPMIVARETGKLYISWMEKPTGLSYKHIRLVRSTDGATSFSDEIQVSNQALRTGDPVLGVSPNGVIWVAWRDYRNDNQDIFAARSADDGNTFGPELKVNDDSGYEYQTSPCIAVDEDGVAYIAWQDSRDPGRNDFDIYFAYSVGTNAFSVNKRINRIDNVAFQPNIALISDGGVFVTYRDMRDDLGGDIYVTGSLDRGQSFSIHHDVKVNDDNEASIQLSPQIAISEDGALHFAWGDGRGLNPSIYYAQSIFP